MKILISDEAYKEFIEFLDDNNITSHNIRVNLAAIVCSGPIFNISENKEEIKEDEIGAEVLDIRFIARKTLIDEYGGFEILSNKETGYNGLSLKPIILNEGGCESCTTKCNI